MTEIDITRRIKLLEAQQLELSLKKHRTTPVPLNWLAGAFLYGFIVVIIAKLASVWAEGPASAKPPVTVQSVIDSIQPMHVGLIDSWPGLVGGVVALAVMYLVVRMRFSALRTMDRDAIFVLCGVAFVLAIPFSLYFLWEPALPAIQAVFDSIRSR